MSVNPRVRDVVRQSWPKRPERRRRSASASREVVAAIRAGEMTVAQGARQLGCDPNALERRVWKETKEAIIARDGRCILCAATTRLDVHHRRRRGAGGTSDPVIAFGMANLVTLCRADHDLTERNPEWARTEGLRLDEGEAPASSRVRRLATWVLLDDAGAVRPIGGEC